METIGYTEGTDEIARIPGPYELLCRTECRCDGAKSLNTMGVVDLCLNVLMIVVGIFSFIQIWK